METKEIKQKADECLQLKQEYLTKKEETLECAKGAFEIFKGKILEELEARNYEGAISLINDQKSLESILSQIEDVPSHTGIQSETLQKATIESEVVLAPQKVNTEESIQENQDDKNFSELSESNEEVTLDTHEEKTISEEESESLKIDPEEDSNPPFVNEDLEKAEEDTQESENLSEVEKSTEEKSTQETELESSESTVDNPEQIEKPGEEKQEVQELPAKKPMISAEFQQDSSKNLDNPKKSTKVIINENILAIMRSIKNQVNDGTEVSNKICESLVNQGIIQAEDQAYVNEAVYTKLGQWKDEGLIRMEDDYNVELTANGYIYFEKLNS